MILGIISVLFLILFTFDGIPEDVNGAILGIISVLFLIHFIVDGIPEAVNGAFKDRSNLDDMHKRNNKKAATVARTCADRKNQFCFSRKK